MRGFFIIENKRLKTVGEILKNGGFRSMLKYISVLEKNYTRIPNKALEILSQSNLSPYEHRILCYFIRKTYGWSRIYFYAKYRDIANATGINISHISKPLKTLLRKNILSRLKEHTTWKYKIQTDFEKWLV